MEVERLDEPTADYEISADEELRRLRAASGFDPITGHGRYRYVEALETAIRAHYAVHYRHGRRIAELENVAAPTPLYWIGYVIVATIGLVVIAALFVLGDLLLRALVS